MADDNVRESGRLDSGLVLEQDDAEKDSRGEGCTCHSFFPNNLERRGFLIILIFFFFFFAFGRTSHICSNGFKGKGKSRRRRMIMMTMRRPQGPKAATSCSRFGL